MVSRSWRTFRYGIFVAIAMVHAYAVYGIVRPGHSSLWELVLALMWALGLYAVTSLGISTGYHRYWTHQSFRMPVAMQYVYAVAGGMACEGPIAKWVKDHTQHHAYTDVLGDPHTPNLLPREAFWWAHILWLFWPVEAPPGYRQTTRLDDDPVVRWQARWYVPIAVSGFVVPFLLAGWPALWLAGFVRVVAHWHVTWAVNSICHRWGQPARRRDGTVIVQRNRSTNNRVVALLGMGEGWHATHHADPNSYELGIHPGEPDAGRWVIDRLVRLGWASDPRPFSR